MKYEVISIAFILLLVVSACTSKTSTPAAEQEQSVPSGELKEFTIEARQFDFEPNTITLKKGDRVKLTFTSKDVTHGVFIIDFEKVTPYFGKGESQTVEFVADKVGRFPYQCSVYCGEGHSEMSGTIIVTE